MKTEVSGPRRRSIPAAVKRKVRERQGGLCGCRAHCGAVLPPDGKGLVQYQHYPALRIRPIREDGEDWIPPQHSVDHIFAEMTECHKRETYEGRNGAFKVGSDRWEIDKMKRHEREKKPSRPFPKRKTKWASRPFRNKKAKP